jgi:multiple sugar transport system permease protein
MALCLFLGSRAVYALSRGIDETARMDGVGILGLLWNIIVLRSLPSLVTTGLLVTAWNALPFALALTSTSDSRTIPVGSANFTNQSYVPLGDIALASAVMTVSLGPVFPAARYRGPYTGQSQGIMT